MRVIAKREHLLTLFKQAAKLSSVGSPIDALQGVLLESDQTNQTFQLSSTNLETSMRLTMQAHVETSGGCILNSRLGVQMLSLLAGEEVTLTLEKNILQLNAQQGQYRIATLPASTYPAMELPLPADYVTISRLPSMIRATGFATTKDGNTSGLNLMFSEKGIKTVSADGFRIMSALGKSEKGISIQMLVPAKSMSLLSTLVTDDDQLQVGTTGKSISFVKNNFIFTARIMSGDFIDTDGIMNSCEPLFTVLSDGEYLHKSIDHVTSFADEHATLSLTFEGAQIALLCESELGLGKNKADVIPLKGIPTGTYYYNVRHLMQCLRAFNGNLYVSVAQGGLLLLSDETTSGMLTPRRATKKTKQKKELPQAA